MNFGSWLWARSKQSSASVAFLAAGDKPICFGGCKRFSWIRIDSVRFSCFCNVNNNQQNPIFSREIIQVFSPSPSPRLPQISCLDQWQIPLYTIQFNSAHPHNHKIITYQKVAITMMLTPTYCTYIIPIHFKIHDFFQKSNSSINSDLIIQKTDWKLVV